MTLTTNDDYLLDVLNSCTYGHGPVVSQCTHTERTMSAYRLRREKYFYVYRTMTYINEPAIYAIMCLPCAMEVFPDSTHRSILFYQEVNKYFLEIAPYQEEITHI